MSNRYIELTDQELEEERVALREELLSRSNRSRIEGELTAKLNEYVSVGGDIQRIFDNVNASSEGEAPREDYEDREDVVNIFETVEEPDAAPPVDANVAEGTYDPNE